jgi:hypothetical protein
MLAFAAKHRGGRREQARSDGASHVLGLGGREPSAWLELPFAPALSAGRPARYRAVGALLLSDAGPGGLAASLETGVGLGAVPVRGRACGSNHNAADRSPPRDLRYFFTVHVMVFSSQVPAALSQSALVFGAS